MTRRALLVSFAAAGRLRGSGDLVRRIAERYGAGGAYSAVATISATSGGVERRQVSATVRHHIQTQGGLYRAEYGSGDRWLWVRGSQESWVYQSTTNEYRSGPNASDFGQEVQAFVQGLHERLGGRFRLLASLNAAFEVLKTEELKVSGVRRSCAVLSIAPRDAAWREKLWVDATGLVWKSVFEEAGDVRRPARTRTTTWEQIEFPSSMDPAVFTFTPPKGARRVKRFGSPPLAEPPQLQFPSP